MPRPDDLDLDLTNDPARDSRPPDDEGAAAGQRLVLVVVVVALVCLALAGWYWWSSRQAAQPTTTAAGATDGAVESASPDRLGTAPPAELPPLNEMDPAIRALLSGLSARPELARLLATDDLVRRFVVSIDRISRGASPAGQVAVLRPDQAFSVAQPYTSTVIRPEAFSRYAGVVSMVESLDPNDLARIYGELRPRLNEAYAELGVPGENFDAAVERAIVHLLSVSPSKAGGKVVPVKGTTYAWEDPATENLSSAQKQLLRLGPTHAREVQAHLRRIAAALGIPAERLPAS